MEELILKAKEWLKCQRYDKERSVDVFPQEIDGYQVVWFWYSDDGSDLPFFLTTPMCDELLSGKNPRRVKNKYGWN